MLAGRALLLVALVVCVALRGAVSPVALLGALLLAGTALLLGSLSPPAEARTFRSFRLALVMAGGLAAFLLLQSWSFVGNPLANPLWSFVSRLAGIPGGAVSVDPAATLDAAFLLVSPFVFYAAALALFPRDEGALRLLFWLGAFGVAFALFGIAQVAFFPRRLLLVEKTDYLDSLTSVFVNRNTAGTFLGVASLIVATLAVRALPRRGGERHMPTPRAGERRPAAWPLVLAAFVVLIALFLTRSRGALLSTMVAVIAVAPFLILDRNGRSRTAHPASWRRALLAFGTVALAVLLVAGLFGGLTIYRMEVHGVDGVRLCLYWSALDAFGQNWRFGAGFGTFASVFPMHRTAGCVSPTDVILRAHNVYIEGLVGLGVGFVPVLLLGYAHVLANLVRGLRQRRRLRAVPLLALGAVILVSLHGLVDFSVQIPGMAAYLATYLAAATTISLGRGRERRSSP
ncbi:O-antigen ligase family protein [Aureimonas flava]|nr:O-antigen ligase family protein [Aureimonas flava]